MKQGAKIMHICSVIIYPLQKKIIGTSTSCLARGKSRVLLSDSLVTHCMCQVVTRTRPNPLSASMTYWVRHASYTLYAVLTYSVRQDFEGRSQIVGTPNVNLFGLWDPCYLGDW